MDTWKVKEFVKQEAPKHDLIYKDGYGYDNLAYDEYLVSSSSQIYIGEYWNCGVIGLIFDTGFHRINDEELYDSLQKRLITFFLKSKLYLFVVSSSSHWLRTRHNDLITGMEIKVGDGVIGDDDDACTYRYRCRSALKKALDIIESFARQHGRKTKILRYINLDPENKCDDDLAQYEKTSPDSYNKRSSEIWGKGLESVKPEYRHLL